MNQENYRRIGSKKISEEIVGQIKALLKGGKLQPGDKLPSERTLANTLGVGRPALREALHHLEALDIVDIRQRQGVFVKNIGSSFIADPLRRILKQDSGLFLYLYEIRQDIEIAAARLAARRRTAEELAEIFDPVHRMEINLEHGRHIVSDDIAFHLAVARATHNFLRVHITQSLFGIADEFLEGVNARLGHNVQELASVVKQHRRVYEAIQDQDERRAGVEMGRHLDWVERKWRQLLDEDRGRRVLR